MHAVERLITTPTLMASAREEIVKNLGEMYTQDRTRLSSIVAVLTRCMALYPTVTGRRLLRRCKGVIGKMMASEPARMQAHMATAANRVIAAQTGQDTQAAPCSARNNPEAYASGRGTRRESDENRQVTQS